MMDRKDIERIPDSVAIVIGTFEAGKEIENSAKEFLGRFECESEESFCDSFEDTARAKELFASYLELIEETLEMLGWGGRSRPYPTDRDIRELIRKQRNFRNELNALDETAQTAENT